MIGDEGRRAVPRGTMTTWWKQNVLSSEMLSHRDWVPCSPEIDGTELALDLLDVLGRIVADEVAEIRISMANCGVDKRK